MKRATKVSIIILVHNAPDYTKCTLQSLKKTETDIPYEVIVLDNASKQKTVKLLKNMKKEGYIDKLILSDVNTLFSKGNNIAVREMADDSEYVLLMNSDIEIRNIKWLDEMIKIHKKGVTALGCCSFEDNRPDGFCYLVDRDLYEKDYLDESYAWFYSLARLSGSILTAGYNVNTIANYENLLYHYGGKSGRVKNASGMEEELSEVVSWFGGKKCTFYHHLDVDDRNIKYNPYTKLNIKAWMKLKVKPYRKKMKKIVYKLLGKPL